MASRLVAAAAAASSSSSSLARIVSRRGLASVADRRGREKVNLWEAPMSPMKWKDRHFVSGLRYSYLEEKENETEAAPPQKK